MAANKQAIEALRQTVAAQRHTIEDLDTRFQAACALYGDLAVLAIRIITDHGASKLERERLAALIARGEWMGSESGRDEGRAA